MDLKNALSCSKLGDNICLAYYKTSRTWNKRLSFFFTISLFSFSWTYVGRTVIPSFKTFVSTFYRYHQ